MRLLIRFIASLAVAVPAMSLALPPPPAQAPTEIVFVAELRPERGSAARFTHRGIQGLPADTAFDGIRRAVPLLQIAPERVRRGQTPLAADAPASILRRQVLLSFPPGLAAAERQRQLEATGLFRRVAQVPDRPTPIRLAQTNSEPFGTASTDPHRWQWALNAIAVPGASGAWHLTTGRAMVGSLDSGIIPGHPDVPTTALANFRGHSSTRIRWLEGRPQLFPAELGITIENQSPPHHGTHVNTLMAAPLNGQGIAGVCPSCTLQTFRYEIEDGLAWPEGWNLAGRFGMTALNMSYEPFSLSGTSAWFWPLANSALAMLNDRDVLIVASAGNDRVARANWNDLDPQQGATIPHGNPAVLKIGATDADNHLWSEARIVSLPDLSKRHPVKEAADICYNNADCIPVVIANRCAGTSGGVQCGSTFGTTNGIIDLVAPGAQVVAGMVAGSNAQPNHYIGLPRDLSAPDYAWNPNAWAPMRTGLGVGPDGVFTNAPSGQHSWGPMTGTSMAAPHVTATAGLMRSINPLLSASEVRTGLKSRANSNPLFVPGYSAERMGAGLLNARHAVENAAGQVRGVYQRNRLAPMFALYAATTTVPQEIGSEELEVFGSQPLHAWLYTTNPQLASAATVGDIYRSGNATFSPTMLAAYEHSHRLHLLQPPLSPIGIPIPPAVYTLPSGAGKGFRNPAASFWVFTTPHSPLSGYPLQPLYRLSTYHASACAAEQRKHLYTASESEALGFIGGTPVCGAHPLLMRYRFESIEGYVYDRAGPQPPGTVPLFRVFSTNQGFNVAALVVQGESLPGYSAPGAADALNNPHFLGWVYRTFQPTQSGVGIEAADLDQDGLPNGVEIALGLNEESANGDCDGLNDAVEYGFANLPADPMSPTATCTDGRLSAVYNAGLQTVTVTLSNPIGPVALPAGTKVVVYFTGVPQPPITLLGGGGSQCQSIATIGWDAAFECTLSSALPVGSTSAVAWQWTNVGGPLFQPGQNVATITAIPGLGDPVSGNNSRSF